MQYPVCQAWLLERIHIFKLDASDVDVKRFADLFSFFFHILLGLMVAENHVGCGVGQHVVRMVVAAWMFRWAHPDGRQPQTICHCSFGS